MYYLHPYKERLEILFRKKKGSKFVTKMEELLPLEIPLDLLFGQRSQLKVFLIFIPPKEMKLILVAEFYFLLHQAYKLSISK